MEMNKKARKKRHPYAALAVFTVAAAGVINAVGKMKKFVTEKADAMKKMLGMKNDKYLFKLCPLRERTGGIPYFVESRNSNYYKS